MTPRENDRRRRFRGWGGGEGLSKSSVGFILLFLAAVRSSAAFVTPLSKSTGTFVRRYCGGSNHGAPLRTKESSLEKTSQFCVASHLSSSLGLVRATSGRWVAAASRRRTHLSMEVMANNPITSRVYGKPDDEEKGAKTTLMNEEILVSGVRFSSD